jgi:3-dehydroquinate synthase
MDSSSVLTAVGAISGMSELGITTSHGTYRVVIGANLVDEVLAKENLVLIDEYVHEHVIRSTANSTIVAPGNEATKTLSGCEKILIEMSNFGVKRDDVLLAVGGGAIQDAATLVASLYMRGIPWVYCPSTAMAMLDSCVGGKSSINLGGIKNLVGNIYPPKMVLVDPTLAAQLPVEAKISGLSEAVKICFAFGPVAFNHYLEITESSKDFGVTAGTEQLLLHVLSAKKWFVEVDEFDKRERQLLNFGHTYAHAFESATGFSLPHGVAVALGMLGAISHPASESSLETTALREYCKNLLSPIQEEIKVAASGLDWSVFDKAVLADKKGTRQSIRLVLPVNSGGLGLVSVQRSQAELNAIRHSMDVGLSEVYE